VRGARELNRLISSVGVSISALGYYPNLLSPDTGERVDCARHLKKVIRAAALLGVGGVNSFVGGDWRKSVDQNWPAFLRVWRPLVAYAKEYGVRVGIENCPMLYTGDEWPGGKNLAYAPAIWQRMFEEIPDEHFGLNYDPSHLVWQRIDYVSPMVEFAGRIFHVHAKDVRIDLDRLEDVGILAAPLEYHTPKLPGLGEVNWGRFFSVLGETGYDGPVCIEFEDRAYEGSMARKRAGLRQAARFFRGFMVSEEKTKLKENHGLYSSRDSEDD